LGKDDNSLLLTLCWFLLKMS